MNSVNHVAIIMDGNGRWGIKNKKSRNLGHKAGLITVEKIIKATVKKNIKYLTLYVFSTENWKRPKKEVSFLFNLLEVFLIKKTIKLNKNNIKLKVVGNSKMFSTKLKKILKDSEKKTIRNKKLQINLALNYGSRDEIVNSINLIKKKKTPITIKNIEKNLYTAGIPDPEILIRTGNTNRLSNFLLWQVAYAEIFFVKIFVPSSCEAILFGPNVLILFFSKKSTIPLTNGCSGPTIINSIFSFKILSFSLLKLFTVCFETFLSQFIIKFSLCFFNRLESTSSASSW